MLSLEHLAELYSRYEKEYQAKVWNFAVGGKQFDFNNGPALMGVINLSPDSWYRESVSLTEQSAVERGAVLAAQGADIIDIGAESTLYQAERVSDEAQKSKLLPVVSQLAAKRCLVSVETYSASVAADALKAGAKVINLTGNSEAEKIYHLAAEFSAAVIICYVQGANVREVADFDLRSDPVELLLPYFEKEAKRAVAAGVSRLFLDPGLGFYYQNLSDSAARVQHQMRVFLNAGRLRALGWPICNALPHAFEYFAEEVRTAEGFFAVLAALGKTDLFRTHEVPRVKAVLKTLQQFSSPR